jgi:mannosylglucosylglycerate synthase
MAAHARVLSQAGHRVRIVAGRAGDMGPQVEVFADPLLGSRGPAIEQVARQLAAGHAGPAFDALVEQIGEQLNTALDGIDVAIVHNVLSLHKNLAFTAALRRWHDRAGHDGAQLLAWCHDFAWLDPLYTPELHDGRPWDLLRTAWPGARYVVVSEDRRAMLARLLGLPKGEVAVVTPGVDLAAFLKLEPETVVLVERLELLPADPLLLLPARITRRKNIEGAIAIVGGLARLGLAPRLIITGPPGPHNPTNAAYLEQLKHVQRNSGAEDSVVFLYETFVDREGRPRRVPDELVSDLYKLADGLLMPSRAEGFGMPLVEAGLAGIPIFCSDIAPFRESAGAAALRFDPDAVPEATAARIAEVLREDARVVFRRRVRLEYTWEAIYRREIAALIEA